MNDEKLKRDDNHIQQYLDSAQRPSFTGPAEIYADENQENTNKAYTYGEPSANQVNVSSAINQYQDLQCELTTCSSHINNGLKQSHHRHSSITLAEEGRVDSKDEEFNLTDFLGGFSKDADQSGIKPKRLGVIWKHLVVKGYGAETNPILTNSNVILKALQPWKLFGIGKKKNSKRTILQSMTGFVKEGEMLLVLGRPDSGCTSFLKILANARRHFTDVNGEVNYGGIDASTFEKRYRGQAIYNEEEDHHLYPTLTTKQTLEFILRCKTPGTRLPNETKKAFMHRIIYLLGNMLGLTKQMDTMVGGSNVPTSGTLTTGERKRLSIAEVMTTLSAITCWDCSTSGLDAVSALDYVRSLRIMTDIFKKTTISTLYQASNTIYKLYDKVVILDNGYCIYFGPTDQAKAYFENLGFYCPGRKPIADFLTGLCNPLERQIRPGFEHLAPQNAPQFEQCYRQSQLYQDMLIALEIYEQEIKETNATGSFEEAVRAEHQKYAPMHDPYTAPFFQQVKALLIRQIHLQRQDRDALLARYVTIVAQAIITSSCFFKLPSDALGALLRCGAIFVSLLFITSLSQSELMIFMTGPRIMEKYRHFAVYRTGVLYIVQLILDVPHAVAQILLYELCSYFMFGFYLDAGRFFMFFIVLVFFNMMINGIYRFIGSCSTNWTLAAQITGSLMLILSTYAGFVIPYRIMKPWLSWIFWFNPFGYSYQALLKNEMKGQMFFCDDPGNSVPEGPGYDWPYKSCLMKGGTPGESFVLGDNFLMETFVFRTSYLWAPDFVVVVAYFLLFAFLTTVAIDYLPSRCGRSISKSYLTGKYPSSIPMHDIMTSSEIAGNKEQERLHCQKQVIDGLIPGTTAFSWHHINYTVSSKKGPLTLVNDVSGIIKPGRLTAVMGSSGAGKTSLLDVLARRKTIGKVKGHIDLNNEALLSDFERITGYCEQTDMLHPTVTVRESLGFSAYLRQEKSISNDEKKTYVEQIITLLELNGIADAQVGDVVYQGHGISVEERRRLSIAMELVSKPKLLFLDEPTSGLDAQGSFNVIRVLRKLADAGLPILCVIHQPSWILFQQFDHLLLLVRGGCTVYNGPIGKDARIIIDYFQLRGAPNFPMEGNPAEYILEVAGSTQNTTSGDHTKTIHHDDAKYKVGYKDWVKLWKESDEARVLDEELEEIHQNVNHYPTRKSYEYATGFWYQLWILQKRMHLDYWRSPGYNVGRFFTCMFISLITGFTYWKMQDSIIDMQNRVFVIFCTFLLAQNLILLAQPRYYGQKLYFQRDYGSRYYSYLSYGISSVLVELPYCIFLSGFFLIGFYWSAGLSSTSDQVGFFFIFIVFFVSWAVTFGFVLAAISRNHLMASVITPLFVSLLILFAGWMRPVQSMPYFWRSWMYWLDPFHYCIEALTVNEMRDLSIRCNQDDFIKFDPPLGRTCGSYMEQFFSSPGSTGYIDNPNATVECNYCQYSTGKEYYTTIYQWSEKNRYRNLGIIIGFFIFNTLLLQLLIYLTRKPKR
ncbi:ABC-2 type transporter-domain-containing protein [Phascolomyces articulosus]|uniref:ABC-2 type transporter-domain-containing protein n=1 Tax=Phascolomyces articulosus TaxID=60185 RepID=A0AAD5K9A8_9FUNG|nr:ABC-2 type transporter-domain-containing protein [Phascolomyces articulosus]